MVRVPDAPLTNQLPANVPEKIAEDGLRTWAHTMRIGDSNEALALGFVLAQQQLLKPFRGANQKINPSLSLFKFK